MYVNRYRATLPSHVKNNANFVKIRDAIEE
jgi:hypothetical protein